MRLRHLLILLSLGAASVAASTQSDNGTWVYSDVDLFRALCAHESLIWIGADLDLREEHWPKDCVAPVRYVNNLTVSGPMDQPLIYTVSFNFMARKIVIPVFGEVRLRQFTARNTRKGGGGEIDFIAYSPNGTLWTDNLNKNQIICLHSDPASLINLPRPAYLPQFDLAHIPPFGNNTQNVTLWSHYCSYGVYGRCWDEVLHYDSFFTDVNVGSDSQTGGYVMAKHNASKTCDAFVSNDCIQASGADKCMADVINAFLAQESSEGVNKLAIALPVALGGTALILALVVLALFIRRRRNRRRTMEEAAAAAAAKKLGDEAAETGADVESGGCGAGAASRLGAVHDSKCVASSSSGGSKEGASSADENVGSRGQPGSRGHNAFDSFRYETNGDMGRCLSGGRGAGAHLSPHGGGSSAGTALVEGVMNDGSVCSIGVGSPLGQGSYGVVFKGSWRDKTVAVKLILCDKAYGEQVMNEVRLMMSDACRHPNLLMAYACMTRARVVNKQAPAAQSLQSTIASLSSSAKNRSGSSAAAVAAVVASGKSAAAEGPELAETWIVSEYCDLGALAPHVHIGKKFLMPADPYEMYGTGGGAAATATATQGQAQDHAPPAAAAEAPGEQASSSSSSNVSSSPEGGNEGDAPPSPFQGQAPRGPQAGLQAAAQGQMDPTAAPVASTAARPPAGGGCRRPRMAPILSCLRDISAGMAHLHSLNIVHGDLKLANVLLCSKACASADDSGSNTVPEGEKAAEGEEAGQAAPDGSSSAPLASSRLGQLPPDMVAKVADFGLSRWLKEGQTHHSTKTVGTVTHMPPELLKSGRLTLSGDVYSFGIMMWELLTGSVPYRGLLYGEVVERVVVSHRRPEFPPHTPVAYRALAERCWAADSAARPTFAAVLSELEAMLAAAATLQAESDSVQLPAWQRSACSTTAATAAASAGGSSAPGTSTTTGTGTTMVAASSGGSGPSVGAGAAVVGSAGPEAGEPAAAAGSA